MKASTTFLNLLCLYLAAGKVLGKKPNAQPKHDPFTDTESDSMDEDDEEDLVENQTGRLPSNPLQGPVPYSAYSAPPPEEGPFGQFLNGLLGVLPPRSSGRPPPRPPSPATTLGGGYPPNPYQYPYGQGVQQQAPPGAAQQQQPWPTEPPRGADLQTVTLTVTANPVTVTNYETVTLRPETSYTVITVTQPGVTSISILPASTVTAEATVTIGGAGAPTVTQYYTYDQVTVTQYYTYPQSTFTVTETAAGVAAAPVTVTFTAPAPPAPPASTVTVTVTTAIANTPSLVSSQYTAPYTPSPPRASPSGAAQNPRPGAPPSPVGSPRPVLSSASTLPPQVTSAAPASWVPPSTPVSLGASSSSSTWYCRTRCDGSWGPGRTAVAQIPKMQSNQQTNEQQWQGYSPGAPYGPSALRGVNGSTTMSTVIAPEGKAKSSPTLGVINDAVYAANHQRVPTLSRNRDSHIVATPAIEVQSPTSAGTLPSQSVVIVEVPASIEGQNIPAEHPKDAGRLNPSNEKKLTKSNRRPDLSPWGPPPPYYGPPQYQQQGPPQWGNQAAQQPYYQQGPPSNLQPWGPGPQPGPAGGFGLPPGQQSGDFGADNDEDVCADGLDGGRPASGMCRAKQKEEEERRAKEQAQQDAERRQQQPQQQPQQTQPQQNGSGTWWNPSTWFGGGIPTTNTFKGGSIFSKGKSRVH